MTVLYYSPCIIFLILVKICFFTDVLWKFTPTCALKNVIIMLSLGVDTLLLCDDIVVLLITTQ